MFEYAILTQKTHSFNLEVTEKTVGLQYISKIEMDFIIPLETLLIETETMSKKTIILNT